MLLQFVMLFGLAASEFLTAFAAGGRVTDLYSGRDGYSSSMSHPSAHQPTNTYYYTTDPHYYPQYYYHQQDGSHNELYRQSQYDGKTHLNPSLVNHKEIHRYSKNNMELKPIIKHHHEEEHHKIALLPTMLLLSSVPNILVSLLTSPVIITLLMQILKQLMLIQTGILLNPTIGAFSGGHKSSLDRLEGNVKKGIERKLK